jgi:hypothetical protein
MSGGNIVRDSVDLQLAPYTKRHAVFFDGLHSCSDDPQDAAVVRSLHINSGCIADAIDDDVGTLATHKVSQLKLHLWLVDEKAHQAVTPKANGVFAVSSGSGLVHDRRTIASCAREEKALLLSIGLGKRFNAQQRVWGLQESSKPRRQRRCGSFGAQLVSGRHLLKDDVAVGRDRRVATGAIFLQGDDKLPIGGKSDGAGPIKGHLRAVKGSHNGLVYERNQSPHGFVARRALFGSVGRRGLCSGCRIFRADAGSRTAMRAHGRASASTRSRSAGGTPATAKNARASSRRASRPMSGGRSATRFSIAARR